MFVLSLQCSQRVLLAYLGFKMFDCVLTRFAARFFAWLFFMLITFIFSYLETFFVVFYFSLFLYPATGRSARDDDACYVKQVESRFVPGPLPLLLLFRGVRCVRRCIHRFPFWVSSPSGPRP